MSAMWWQFFSVFPPCPSLGVCRSVGIGHRSATSSADLASWTAMARLSNQTSRRHPKQPALAAPGTISCKFH